MRVFTDQLGRKVRINYPPKRIISLVPSQTELLFDLGLGERIVGVTKFCIHPAEKLTRITKVGGTKQLNLNVIQNLRPDLIIGNKEENEQTQVEFLMQNYPVWISDIVTLPDALQMITAIGGLTGTPAAADGLVNRITDDFGQLKLSVNNKKVLYLIWQKPFMAVGHDTFINDMLQRCGFVNAAEDKRYPEISTSGIKKLTVDIILLSTEPYPFKQKHITQFQDMMPGSKVLLVDGEMFSWYGSRLQFAASYFRQLIATVMTDINN